MPDTTAFDTRAYRRALGCFATGVAVVTTRDTASPRPAAGAADGSDADRWIGITINSFQSVSLLPPLVLWCIDRASDRFALFTRARAFTISILAADQSAISDRFARASDPALPPDLVVASASPGAAPSVAGAIARFECTLEQAIDAGDHVVLLGRVGAFAWAEGAALTYFRGAYGHHG